MMLTGVGIWTGKPRRIVGGEGLRRRRGGVRGLDDVGLAGFLASRVDAQCLYKAETGVIWGRSASTARNRDGGLSSPPGGAEQGTNGG